MEQHLDLQQLVDQQKQVQKVKYQARPLLPDNRSPHQAPSSFSPVSAITEHSER